MDWHPIQDEVHVVVLLVTVCWVSCDGLASHPGGVVILLVTLCWLSCDGLAYHPVGVAVLPVAYRAVVVQFYPWFNFLFHAGWRSQPAPGFRLMEFFHRCHKLARFLTFLFPVPLAQGTRDVPKNCAKFMGLNTSNYVQVRLGWTPTGEAKYTVKWMSSRSLQSFTSSSCLYPFTL